LFPRRNPERSWFTRVSAAGLSPYGVQNWPRDLFAATVRRSESRGAGAQRGL